MPPPIGQMVLLGASVVGMIIGVVVLGAGAAGYADASSMTYTETTCTLVRSENWDRHCTESGSGTSKSTSCTYSCDYIVTSAYTGTTQHTVNAGASEGSVCSAFGSASTKTCYAKEKDGKVEAMTFDSQGAELMGKLVMIIVGGVVGCGATGGLCVALVLIKRSLGASSS